MTRKATSNRDTEEAPLRHYNVEEAAGLLGVSKRWLYGQAAARAIHCTYIAGNLRFTAEHIRAISRAGEVDPATHGRRPAAARIA